MHLSKVLFKIVTLVNFFQTSLFAFSDCIECMACSDNVIRAGLTPKFRDVESLCRLVKYSFVKPSDVLFLPSKHLSDPYMTIYNAPTPEFSVDRIEVWGSLSPTKISKCQSCLL